MVEIKDISVHLPEIKVKEFQEDLKQFLFIESQKLGFSLLPWFRDQEGSFPPNHVEFVYIPILFKANVPSNDPNYFRKTYFSLNGTIVKEENGETNPRYQDLSYGRIVLKIAFPTVSNQAFNLLHFGEEFEKRADACFQKYGIPIQDIRRDWKFKVKWYPSQTDPSVTFITFKTPTDNKNPRYMNLPFNRLFNVPLPKPEELINDKKITVMCQFGLWFNKTRKEWGISTNVQGLTFTT
jgi:hypothetical protein